MSWSKEGAKHHKRALSLILIHSPGEDGWRLWVSECMSAYVCGEVTKRPATRLIHSVNYLWSEISLGREGCAEIRFRKCALWGSCLRSWSRLIFASPELFANNTAPREKRLLTTEHLLQRNDLLICWGVENQREVGAWYIGEICRGGRRVHETELRQTYSWGRIDAEVFMRWTWSSIVHERVAHQLSKLNWELFFKFLLLNLISV